LNRNPSKLLMCISEIVIGVLLLINPVGFTEVIIRILGVIAVIAGIADIIRYFRVDIDTALQKGNLAVGIILCLAGVFCVFCSGWFISTFPIFTIFYGLLMLISGIYKIQWTVDMVRLKNKYWFIALIGALFTLVFAVIVLMNPFTTTVVLWRFTAITIIAEAIADILVMAFERK
ncbi:MAG: DUF308 domain-containing protein, partial [Firmicutes bacterium]|nr:DUF308 domain-containing protein [Bacillota bacterium]